MRRAFFLLALVLVGATGGLAKAGGGTNSVWVNPANPVAGGTEYFAATLDNYTNKYVQATFIDVVAADGTYVVYQDYLCWDGPPDADGNPTLEPACTKSGGILTSKTYSLPAGSYTVYLRQRGSQTPTHLGRATTIAQQAFAVT